MTPIVVETSFHHYVGPVKSPFPHMIALKRKRLNLMSNLVSEHDGLAQDSSLIGFHDELFNSCAQVGRKNIRIERRRWRITRDDEGVFLRRH